jgi:hypothetical protein
VDGGLVGAGVGAVAGAAADAAWEAGVHFCRGLLSTVFFNFLVVGGVRWGWFSL